MMKNTFFLAFIFLAFLANAQEITSRTNKKNIQVGEPFNLEFEIEIDSKDKIKFSPKKETIRVAKTNKEQSISDSATIDILTYSSTPNENIQGKNYWKANYEMICFEEGWYIFPPQEFIINGKVLQSSPELIIVSLVAKQKGVDIYDIEESFQELPSPFFENVKQILFWSILAIVLIALGLSYYFFVYKKKPKEEKSIVKALTQKEMAINELNILMKKELWEKDQLKEHFTQVSLIVRRFLSAEIGESLMERTSFETHLILRKKGFSDEKLKPLDLMLNVSDMVKFAQSTLEKEGIFSVYQDTKSFIENFEIY
jgi:hypothetical protein